MDNHKTIKYTPIGGNCFFLDTIHNHWYLICTFCQWSTFSLLGIYKKPKKKLNFARVSQRKPKELKEIEGTYRKDRDNLNPIPSTIAVISTVPEELNEWGAKLWQQIDADFSKIGVIKTSDVGSLLALCLEYGTMLEAYDLIAAQGLMVLVPIYSAKGDHVRDDWQVNPARKVASDAFKNYKSMCIEFGLTPVSRIKLSVPEQKADDEFEEFN